MLTFQEQVLQIGMLREHGLTFDTICRSLHPAITPQKAFQLYWRYFQPFSDEFQSIIKELQRPHLAKYKEECRTLLYLSFSRIKEGTKFRNVKLLTPIVSYVVFRLKGEIIKVREFLHVSNISFSDFKEGLLVINPFYREYSKREQDLIERIRVEFTVDPIHEVYVKSLKALSMPVMAITSSRDDMIDEFTSFYLSIQEKISIHSKYKKVEVSGPIVLYMFLKTKGTLIVLPEFLDAFQLSYNVFTTDLKIMITRYYPEYTKRDKTSIMKGYVISILNSFYLSNEELYSNAFILQDHFHLFLHHAKEEVIAAVVCVLAMISCELPGISMSDICGKVGITQSSLNRFFLERIFPYMGIPDTITLKHAFPFIKREIQEKIPLRKALVEKINSIPPTIHEKIILDYLGELLNKIKVSEISGVNQSLLEEIMYYASDIKITIHEMVRLLKEEGTYKKEELVLGAAVYLSCPFINATITGKILFRALSKKAHHAKISQLLRQISFQKVHIRHLFLPFKHVGRVLEQGRTDIRCNTCGNVLYLLRLADDVMLTACKQCLQKQVIE